MHILIMPSWYKSSPGEVLGSFFEEQARALQKKGHQVGIQFQIFYPASEIFKKRKAQPGYVNDNGLPTFIYTVQGIIPRSRKFNDAYETFFSERIFKKYVKKFGMPDIIHAHSVFHAGIFGLHLSKKFNIPLVITEHLTHYITGRLSLVDDIPQAINVFKNAECSLVVGSVFKNELSKAVNLPENTFGVVSNMVSDLFFKDIKEKKYTQGEEFIFFTNSFLNARKNHILIFDSLKVIIDKGYNVKLIVGGGGEAESDLKEYVKNNSLQKNVYFTGILSRIEVKENIDHCHAFLLASTYETFGVVLIEALAGGKPIITTDSGGPKDIVKTDKIGILLKSFEVEEFVGAMESVIVNYENYKQKEISKYAADIFSEDVIAHQLIDIYTRLIKNKHK